MYLLHTAVLAAAVDWLQNKLLTTCVDVYKHRLHTLAAMKYTIMLGASNMPTELLFPGSKQLWWLL